MTLDRAVPDDFETNGYAVARGILDRDADLEPLRCEYAALLDGLARCWHAENRLPSAYEDLDFEHRFARVLAEVDLPMIRYFDISLGKSRLTEDSPLHVGPAVFHLIRSPRLLDAVESFLGGEIYSNPIQHVRMKPNERLVPKHRQNALTASTPWHQDLGVALPEADDSNVLAVWIPVTNAGIEDGCLEVIPGSHKGDLLTHCRNVPGTRVAAAPHIREAQIDARRAVPVPMLPGDVLFFHKKTIHRSLPNQSSALRWSFDIRYNPVGQPTGRPEFPGFVARSRSRPEQELTDPAAWAAIWRKTRSRLAAEPQAEFHRWPIEDLSCA